ncbi:hypothetical protein AND_001326 [Anopheles darlingi]|uniref:Uncharacterized protein n=1 Tax=Anopheles darlingi TaxID=43151 RepID=W5JVL4_ANODA|nr:hypothetical protein AND_001326 [Anopheles darlingi]
MERRLSMKCVGVILVTVSGAAWRMTAPGAPPCLGLGSTVDLGRCSRRPCGRGGSTPHGLLYPEFQHRPPPPSYQASMQEYRLRLLLLDRDRQSGRMRSTASPPPTYRSNVGSLLRIPLSSRYNNGSSNSIFGGISGIISGAVGGGGGSSNSVVDHQQLQQQQQQQHQHHHHHQQHQPPPSAKPPNPYGVGSSGSSDGHSTLPPSYRSVELHPVVETVHRQPQPQSSCSSTSNVSNPAVVDPPQPELVTNGAGHDEGRRQSTTSVGAVVGSIIKIDDRRNSTTTTMAASPTATCNEPAMTMTSGDAAAIAEPANQEKHPMGSSTISSSITGSSSNTMVKDLVTIVTISGTIEPSSSGVSVYTTSSSGTNSGAVTNGNGTTTNTVSAAALAGGGAGCSVAGSSTGRATCTLLNSNSTPLLATVIPVSKAVTTTSSQPVVIGPVLQC